MAPKWTSLGYSGLLSGQPLRLALVDLTDKYSTAWKHVPPSSQFNLYAYFFRFFSLLPPLPMAAFSTIMAKRKATVGELLARAESNGYKKGPYREEDSTQSMARS